MIDSDATHRLAARVVMPEARYFYGFQAMKYVSFPLMILNLMAFRENIHAETYSMLINTLVDDETKRQSLFQARELSSIMTAKTQWAM